MAKPYVTDASDPAQLKAAERKVRSKESTEQADLLSVLSHREGRRFLMRVIRRAGLDDDCLDPSGSRVYANLGQRVVALQLQLEIKSAGLEHWHLMETEEREDQGKEP